MRIPWQFPLLEGRFSDLVGSACFLLAIVMDKPNLRTTGSWSLQAPQKTPFDKAVPLPETQIVPTEAGDSAARIEADAGKDGKKSGNSRERDAAKKKAACHPVLPKGARIKPIDKDGNCCFAAIAGGVAAIDKTEPKNVLQVRAGGSPPQACGDIQASGGQGTS